MGTVSRNPEHAIWDAVYCTDSDTEPATMTGSLAAIRTWVARVNRERRVRHDVFELERWDRGDTLQWGTDYWWLVLTPNHTVKPPVEAYSENTGKTYPTFEDLVDAEANGWLALAIVSNGRESWPWAMGPFPSKREANNARNRMRSKFNRDPQGCTAKFFVRPAWKDFR